MIKVTILEETGLKPNYLELEITENVVINHKETINTICELHKLGIMISMDDFGTGNSTINYLSKLPINQLKIDKSFVENIGKNISNYI